MSDNNVRIVSEIDHTWERYAKSGSEHVIPYADLHPHELSSTCWCEPEEDEEAPLNTNRWMHNAADRREEYEIGSRLHH